VSTESQRAVPERIGEDRTSAASLDGPAVVQRKATVGTPEHRSNDIAAAAATQLRVAPSARIQRAARRNDTGMPDALKSGIESMSGISMDEARVHYNSSRPAALGALAYAAGTDIHLGPGQEHHLPHEAWHLVQQAQGRVRPTMQLKHGSAVNDDSGLEREATEMGARALLAGDRAAAAPRSSMPGLRSGAGVAQRAPIKVGDDGAGVMFLASRHFDAAWKEAKAVLEEMKAAGTEFVDVDAIVAAVSADPRVSPLMKAAAVKREELSAAQAAREKSPVLVKYRQGNLTEYDVEHGTWRLMTDDKHRKHGDYELLVTLGASTFSFHVHPPQYAGRLGTPGQVMIDNRMSDTQTPTKVLEHIKAKLPTPPGW
jgi:hypothetical protein